MGARIYAAAAVAHYIARCQDVAAARQPACLISNYCDVEWNEKKSTAHRTPPRHTHTHNEHAYITILILKFTAHQNRKINFLFKCIKTQPRVHTSSSSLCVCRKSYTHPHLCVYCRRDCGGVGVWWMEGTQQQRAHSIQSAKYFLTIKGDVYLLKAHLNPLSFTATAIYAVFEFVDSHTHRYILYIYEFTGLPSHISCELLRECLSIYWNGIGFGLYAFAPWTYFSERNATTLTYGYTLTPSCNLCVVSLSSLNHKPLMLFIIFALL